MIASARAWAYAGAARGICVELFLSSGAWPSYHWRAHAAAVPALAAARVPAEQERQAGRGGARPGWEKGETEQARLGLEDAPPPRWTSKPNFRRRQLRRHLQPAPGRGTATAWW